MGEILFELLIGLFNILLEILFEVILQFAIELLVDLVSRALSRIFKSAELGNPLLAAVGYFLLGAFFGRVSVACFPHPLVHPSRIHGISLLIGPALTGLVMSWIGSRLRRQEKKTVRIESFAYGFTFAFGFALVRFFLIK